MFKALEFTAILREIISHLWNAYGREVRSFFDAREEEKTSLNIWKAFATEI